MTRCSQFQRTGSERRSWPWEVDVCIVAACVLLLEVLLETLHGSDDSLVSLDKHSLHYRRLSPCLDRQTARLEQFEQAE